MKKIKVKMLDSVSGLADPKPPAALDEKYRAKIQTMNRGREKPFSQFFVDQLIGEMKKHDRYGEKALGFPRDWSFKPGDEPMINEELARQWEEAGICTIIREDGKKAA